MILFRARKMGQEWSAMLSIQTPGEEELSDVAESIGQIVGSALSTSPLHVQMMNEDGEWEDVE